MEFSYTEVTIESKTVEGIGAVTSNAENQFGSFWERFFKEEVSSIENRVNDKSIGFYGEYESDYKGKFLFLACCEVTKESENKNHITKKIESGKYAKFTISGMNELYPLWQYIWNSELNRKYKTDFEEYSSNGEISVYVGIN